MYPRSSEIILDEEVRAAMREVIRDLGSPVDFDLRYAKGDDFSKNPGFYIDYYGWEDYDISRHLRHDCQLMMPDSVTIREVDFTQFGGTDADSDEYHGILATGDIVQPIRCECGEYDAISLLYLGTFSDILKATLARLGRAHPDEDDLRKGIRI
jgi:hypothetical protein